MLKLDGENYLGFDWSTFYNFSKPDLSFGVVPFLVVTLKETFNSYHIWKTFGIPMNQVDLQYTSSVKKNHLRVT